MNEEMFYASYSELSVGNPDFIDLAERCELLSQIIVDASHSESITPVLRCLSAYLEKLSVSLDEDMGSYRVIELSAPNASVPLQNWVLADSDLQCEYCRTLTALLLRNVGCLNEREVLTGLLHDLISSLAFELKEPRFI
jgi:hypothetical protein